jgi:hypothetical protein
LVPCLAPNGKGVADHWVLQSILTVLNLSHQQPARDRK